MSMSNSQQNQKMSIADCNREPDVASRGSWSTVLGLGTPRQGDGRELDNGGTLSCLA